MADKKKAQAAELPVCEALVVRPGDHLIVRVEADITRQAADETRQLLLDRLPQLADVTVINAAGLAVLRDEADHG